MLVEYIFAINIISINEMQKYVLFLHCWCLCISKYKYLKQRCVMMKRLLTVLVLIMALSSCQKDIVLYRQFIEKPVMVAELQSSDTVHTVAVAISTPDSLRVPAGEVKVKCYVNGSFVSESDGYSNGLLCRMCQFKASFAPGDKVKLVVDTEVGTAYAEDTFPKKCQISIDTTSTQFAEYYDDRIYSFVMTVADVPGEKTYFKAIVPDCHYRFYKYRRYPSAIFFYSEFTRLSDNHYFEAYSIKDPVFNNADSSLPSSVTSATGIEGMVYYNSYLIFTDEDFEDGSYQFVFKDYINQRKYCLMMPDTKSTESFAQFRCATISEKSFRYYRSLNIKGGELTAPVPTMSNVSGGTGWVSAMTTDEVIVSLKTIDNRWFEM